MQTRPHRRGPKLGCHPPRLPLAQLGSTETKFGCPLARPPAPTGLRVAGLPVAVARLTRICTNCADRREATIRRAGRHLVEQPLSGVQGEPAGQVLLVAARGRRLRAPGALPVLVLHPRYEGVCEYVDMRNKLFVRILFVAKFRRNK